ncbi:unnamed protein product [Enterobius vermicularis]|uniref:Uncharacterized protein n=1 Tax=Enterobius vermicularis TaxID=51028 RepID=A0A0N4VQF8_ENTVE|nr:unnamed protein product [Enterobius vermicularis]
MSRGEQEIDLSQLFSDVSRTVHGIKSMLGSNEASTDSHNSGLFPGNVCLKACGMEDIQFAARFKVIV